MLFWNLVNSPLQRHHLLFLRAPVLSWSSAGDSLDGTWFSLVCMGVVLKILLSELPCWLSKRGWLLGGPVLGWVLGQSAPSWRELAKADDPALPCPARPASFTNSQASCQLSLPGWELTRTSGGSLSQKSISEGWGWGFPDPEGRYFSVTGLFITCEITL